ncbi:MAG TPA: hypothetical protein VEB86_08575 [Chryseosolibacter sp.]|nr:hypothetical protein [Chryseosolibacter sp.]
MNQRPNDLEWGYQALIEDADGRKVELKDEDVTVARYQIEDRFKITGRRIVLLGVILDGVIYIGDVIGLSVKGETRKRRIKGIDSSGMRTLPLTDPPNRVAAGMC